MINELQIKHLNQCLIKMFKSMLKNDTVALIPLESKV